MKSVHRKPEQKARLQADGSLLSNAVHEITRMVSPVIFCYMYNRDARYRDGRCASPRARR